MTITQNGGPAFPTVFDNGEMGSETVGGMTLRDWFAGQALAGILANDNLVSPELLRMFGGEGKTRGDVASIASYAYADAMLAAREFKP